MKPKVYVETSIPSFFFDERPEPENVARREWTQEWWRGAQDDYALLTSDVVIDELERGNYPNKDKCLMLIKTLPLLRIEEQIQEIVEVYVKNKLMPSRNIGDALHLAIASYHKCDFLVTWNCRHLANANKFQHIRRINEMMNLYVPMLVTPLELTKEK